MGKIIEHHHSLERIAHFAIDQLQRGTRSPKHPFKNTVFSTFEVPGPDSRMVVSRKVHLDPFVVEIFTDMRSEKIGQLRKVAFATLLFWHPTARLQVKLMTTVAIHHKDAEAKEAWGRVGEHGRASYNTMDAPGSVWSTREWSESNLRKSLDDEFFALVRCQVDLMEVLQLSRAGHIRAQFNYDNGSLVNSSFLVP